MVFQRYINGIDQCEPPVCPEDILVVIDNWNCSNNILYVEWIIEDVYDRTFDVSFNRLLWSCSSPDFDNSVSSTTVAPYSASADISECTGIIYFKIQLQINNTVFESEERTISIEDCQQVGDEMVRATLCSCDIAQIDPGYHLYVNETGIPTRPVYFAYDERCWFIDEDAWDNKIPVDPAMGTVIDSVTEEYPIMYSSCEGCCLNLDCPTDWVDIPGGDGLQVANFYIVYNTFTIRDHIVIIRNFDADNDCGPLSELPQEKRLWDSGCVGTSRINEDSVRFPMDCTNRPCSDGGEGPGYYINTDPLIDYWDGIDVIPGMREYYETNLKAVCFLVYTTDLPIGISVDADCGMATGSVWCLTVAGPGITPTTLCDGDTDACDEIDNITSSSSSFRSSSSSSESQLSSSSSSSLQSSSSSSQKSSSSSSKSSSSSSSSNSSSSSSAISSGSSLAEGTCEFCPNAPRVIYVTISGFSECGCVHADNITWVEGPTIYNGETANTEAHVNKTWAVPWDSGCIWSKTFVAVDEGEDDYGDWYVYENDCETQRLVHGTGVYDQMVITVTVQDGDVAVVATLLTKIDEKTCYDYIFNGTIASGSGCFQEGGVSTNTKTGCACAGGGYYNCDNWDIGDTSVTVSIST